MIELSKKIKITDINTDVVKQNVDYICKNIHIPMKNIYNNMHLPIETPISNNNEYVKIFNYVKDTHLTNFVAFNKVLDNVKKFCKLQENNVTLYYPCNAPNKKFDLFKIALSLAIFFEIKKQIIIIWIPTNLNRDFADNYIDEKTLNKSYNNFGAFTTSGLTFHDNSNVISIVTRNEEIEKLLIHELCHAFNLDGSGNSSSHKNIIKKYNLIKPPKNYVYDYCIHETYAELLSSYLFLTFKDINLPNEEFKHILYQQILTEILYSFNIIANLIVLNGKNYDSFITSPSFNGEMCFYEYYYLKALMYNDYLLKLYKSNEFYALYDEILKNMQIRDIPLLKNVCDNMVKVTNFKYMFW